MSIGLLPGQLAQRCWSNFRTCFHHASHCCDENLTTKQTSALILLPCMSPRVAVPDGIPTLSRDISDLLLLRTPPYSSRMRFYHTDAGDDIATVPSYNGKPPVDHCRSLSFLFATGARAVALSVCASPPG